MKKTTYIFSLLLLLTSAVFANGEVESEKTKSYTKTYSVGGNDKISLDNKFGDMKITTWAKNEIRVEVNISVKARNEEQAQKLIDVINIVDGKSGNDISFKTHFDNKGRNRNNDNDDNDDGIKKNNNSSFRINYTVYLPSNATLDAVNTFGDITMGDFDGLLGISSRFGSLTAGKLSQPRKVVVQFGKKLSVVEAVNGGKLSIQFSQAVINKLSGEVSADFNQSHGVKIKIDNSLKKLEIANNFGEILIDAPKNLSASFKIKASFGKFKNESAFAIDKIGDDDRYSFRNNNYAGKSGAGETPITIKTNFGAITLGHDLVFDAVGMSKTRDKVRM